MPRDPATPSSETYDPELALQRALALADAGANAQAIRTLEALLDAPVDLDLRVRAGVALGETLLTGGQATAAEAALAEAVALAEDARASPAEIEDPEEGAELGDAGDLGTIAAAEAERARTILDGIR